MSDCTAGVPVRPWLLAPRPPVILAPPSLGFRLENHPSESIMPRRSFITSTSRRYRKADEILACGTFVMRPCSHYVSAGSACVLSEISEKCSQYYRFDRSYDLASLWPEVHYLL
jgi:hypothetical protein